MPTQNKNLRIVFIAAICFVFIISIFSYTKINSLIDSAALVNHTTQVTLNLEKVIGSLKDAETGQRGYLLTHDQKFLEPFIKGLKEYPQNIKSVKQLIIDNPDQQKSLSAVEQLAQNREDYMRKMLEVDKLRKPTTTELSIGKSIMDSLRAEINIMIAREDSLMQHRTNQLHNQTMIAPAMLLILSLMALAIIIVSYWQLNKSLVQAQLLKAEAIQQAVQFEKTKEIQASEKRYNMMLMKSPFCFGVIKGKDMIITLANAAIKEVWGKGFDIEGKPFLEILPELINTAFPNLIQNVMTTGLPYYGYDMLAELNKNGKLEDGYFNFVYQPYYESDETISGVTIIAIEVTKEVKAKRQLQESEMRFRNMVEQAPVAICVLRGENYVVEVANKKQLEIFGKTKGQVLNQPLFTAVPESTAQGFEELLNGVFTTGKPFIANEIPSMLTRHGKKGIFYSNFISEPLYNDEHKIDGIVSVVTDVTEQVVARKQVEESEQRFQAAIEAVEGILWTNNGNGEMEGEQPGWASLTGQTYEEYQGYGWATAVHPDDAQPTVDAWHKAVQERRVFVFEHRVKTKHYGYRYFSIRAIPLLNPDGSLRQWVGVHSDIQDQKAREENKDEFISIASHEMKTPLTTAKAYLQMLELSLDENDEDSTLFAKKASQSINRLNELVSELLDVSKIRLGKLNYTITTFNFNEMIESTVENVQVTSPTHKIIKTGKVFNNVTGDKDRLQQVVINLLNNAVKYSPGAEEIFINVEQEENIIKVSVRDKGIGMNSQSLSKIFEKYHRIEEHAVHFQGLGIGLFISHEIIQRHYGKLWVESEPRKGSTFYFTIPLDITSLQ